MNINANVKSKKHNLRSRIVLSEISTNASNNRNVICNFFSTYNPTVAESLENFFQAYNPRLVTQLDFYIWRVRQRENWTNEDIRASKEAICRRDVEPFFNLLEKNPRGFVKWCEQELATTLEKNLHPNINIEIVDGDFHHREAFQKYVFLQ
ncbi:23103_t:CDS:2, partial [Gigaspora rosea]